VSDAGYDALHAPPGQGVLYHHCQAGAWRHRAEYANQRHGEPEGERHDGSGEAVKILEYPDSRKSQTFKTQRMRIKLTLYSRRGCHLCEDMLSQLNELRSEYAFSLEVRDVDSDPIWVEQFGEAVPILLVGQVEICRYFLDQKALLSHLDIN